MTPRAAILMFQNVGSDRARHPAHVFESKIVGDDAAPAVGAEFDIGIESFSRQSLVASRQIHSRLDVAQRPTDDCTTVTPVCAVSSRPDALRFCPTSCALLASGDQQSIFRLHHHQIAHAQHRHEFPRRVNVISLSIEREDAAAGNQVVVRGPGSCLRDVRAARSMIPDRSSRNRRAGRRYWKPVLPWRSAAPARRSRC